ncbi:retrovirus-related pol polyprotein from transposon TNT 1-94 [Tanacetum coccineum]
MSNPTSKPSDASPVKIKAPKELPKLSLVNESLKKLKFHLARFDNVVKIKTTPDARTKGEWGFEHTKAIFNNEIILFLKSLKDIFNVFDKVLLNKIIETSFDKQCLEIAKKELLLENDRLLQQIMSQDVLLTVMNSMSLIGESVNMERKEIIDIAAQTPSAYTIVLGMFKLDLEPLSPRLLQNREAHIDYLKYTQEQANILQGIELLVYVRYTCPNAIKLSAKKVVVTPKNNVKKVRLKCSISNYGPKPKCNKKNDRISRTPNRNIKNKVEAQPKKVNKKNHVVEPIRDVDIKHSLLKANSELNCVTCSSIKAKIVESKNANHSEPNHTWGSNAIDIPSSFSLVMIAGKCDYLKSILCRGARHNLFFAGQFCDADIEVVFQKNTCFIRNLEGVDLLFESRDTNLYAISLDDMLKTSLICLLSKASKTKRWLWHHRLSHLNFGTLNKLAKDGLARGIPRLKF